MGHMLIDNMLIDNMFVRGLCMGDDEWVESTDSLIDS